MLQYLVAYGLLVQLAANVAQWVDGSEFSVLQVAAAEFITILCMRCCCVLGHAMLCSVVCCTVLRCGQGFPQMQAAATLACMVHMHQISQAQQELSLKQRLYVQRSTLDFVAITLGMVVGLRRAALQLTLRRPPAQLCVLPNFAALLATVLIISFMHWALQAFLQHQSFYKSRSFSSQVLHEL